MTSRCWISALGAALLITSAGCTGASAPEGERPAPTESATESPGESPGPAPVGSPVTIMGAGDIAGDEEDAAATADLIRAADPDAVFTTGDNAYPDGSPEDYAKRYEPTWGAFKDRTHPVPGNHDYHTDDAAGYVDYFGAENVTNSVDGGLYYAWDVGNGWRAYALNTEISTSGAQLRWLRDDLAAHPDRHYILYAHSPRYTSGKHGPSEDICPLWDALAATGGLEIVLAGHNHQYERFEPMDCDGRRSPDGARSFVIGSGGNDMYDFDEVHSASEFRNNSDYGVLKLDLYEDSYEWEFIASGQGEDPGTRLAGQILDKGSEETGPAE
jgi:3',5'-cyclic AMP phosphodiesterase CpdA